MANYNTLTKIIVGTIPDGTEDSGTSGTLSEKINTFWQTLDTSSGAVQSMSTVYLGGHTVAVVIVYLG
jgi:hypothetical protein